MTRKNARHVRLDHLARKLLEKPPAQWPIPDDYEVLLKQLQRERLDLTDYEFRKRYGLWL